MRVGEYSLLQDGDFEIPELRKRYFHGNIQVNLKIGQKFVKHRPHAKYYVV